MVEFEIYQDRLWADVLAYLGGVDATFTPLTGEPSSFRVLFTESMQLQPSGQTETWLQTKTIEYSLADLAREAKVGESFIIGGTRHIVQSITNNDGYVIKVVVR